jgi:hypothetical protein
VEYSHYYQKSWRTASSRSDRLAGIDPGFELLGRLKLGHYDSGTPSVRNSSGGPLGRRLSFSATTCAL